MRKILDAAHAHPDRRVTEHRVLAAHDEVVYTPALDRPRSRTPAPRDSGLGNIAPSPAHAEVDFLLARHHPFLALGSEAAPCADGFECADIFGARAQIMAG